MGLNLPKRQINGTRAFIFLLANMIKIPAQVYIGNLKFVDYLLFVPLSITAGVIALLTERFIVPKINQLVFERVAWGLVTLSALEILLR